MLEIDILAKLNIPQKKNHLKLNFENLVTSTNNKKELNKNKSSIVHNNFYKEKPKSPSIHYTDPPLTNYRTPKQHIKMSVQSLISYRDWNISNCSGL